MAIAAAVVALTLLGQVRDVYCWPREMSEREIHAMENAVFEASDWLPGTSLSIWFTFGNDSGPLGRRGPWQLGDELVVRCSFVPADSTRGARDSLELRGVLGAGELPLGLEWMLLAGDPIYGDPDWSEPVGFPARELEGRAAPATPGRGYWGNVWVTLVSADTSERPYVGPALARRRHALAAYREGRYDAAQILLEQCLETAPHDSLLNALLAGALEGQLDCVAYARQCVLLQQLGLRTNSPPVAREEELCERQRRNRATAERWEREEREAHAKWEAGQRGRAR